MVFSIKYDYVIYNTNKYFCSKYIIYKIMNIKFFSFFSCIKIICKSDESNVTQNIILMYFYKNFNFT